MIALIVAGGGAFNGVLAFLQYLVAQKNHGEISTRVKKAHDDLAGQVEVVRKDVDGQTEKLVALTAKSSRAEGVIEGRAAQKAEPDTVINATVVLKNAPEGEHKEN